MRSSSTRHVPEPGQYGYDPEDDHTIPDEPVGQPRTWLDVVDSEMVEEALRRLDTLPAQPVYLERAAGDVRFSLWLRLVDEQINRVAPGRHPNEDWRGLYETGTSPRSAAYVALDQDRPSPDTLQLGTKDRETLCWALRVADEASDFEHPLRENVQPLLDKLTPPTFRFTDTPAWDFDPAVPDIQPDESIGMW